MELSRRARSRKARSTLGRVPGGTSTLAQGQRSNFRSQKKLEMPLQRSSEVLLILESEKPGLNAQPCLIPFCVILSRRASLSKSLHPSL